MLEIEVVDRKIKLQRRACGDGRYRSDSAPDSAIEAIAKCNQALEKMAVVVGHTEVALDGGRHVDWHNQPGQLGY